MTCFRLLIAPLLLGVLSLTPGRVHAGVGDGADPTTEAPREAPAEAPEPSAEALEPSAEAPEPSAEAPAPSAEVPPEPSTDTPAAPAANSGGSDRVRGVASAVGVAGVVLGAVTAVEWVLASITLLVPLGTLTGIYALSLMGVKWAQGAVAGVACLVFCGVLCFPAASFVGGGLVSVLWTLESLLGPLVSLLASGFAGVLGWGAVSLTGNRRAPLLPITALAMAPQLVTGALGCLIQAGALALMLGTCAAVNGNFSEGRYAGLALGAEASACLLFLLAPLCTSTIGNLLSVATSGLGAWRMGRDKEPGETFELDVLSTPEPGADEPEPL